MRIVKGAFFDLTANLSVAKMWISRFLYDKLNMLCQGQEMEYVRTSIRKPVRTRDVESMAGLSINSRPIQARCAMFAVIRES